MRRYYGWPDDFRRDAWAEVAERISDEAWDAEDRLEKYVRLQNRVENMYTEQRMEKATAEVVAKLGLNTV